MLTAIILTAAALFVVLALVARLARTTGHRYTETWICTICQAEFPNEWDASLHVEIAHRGHGDD